MSPMAVLPEGYDMSMDLDLACFYDWYGMPIGFDLYCELSEPPASVDVASTPHGYLTILTSWMGLAYGFEDEQPLIFETAVCSPDDDWVVMRRYSDAGNAQNGHKIVVGMFRIHSPLPALHRGG